MVVYSEQESANLALVRSMYETMLFPLDVDAVDAHISQNYIQHSSLAEPGIEGLKSWLRAVHPQRDDVKQTIHRLLADGDYVMAHTHVVRWPGDRGAAVMDIYRIADGRIQEHWDVIQDIAEQPVNPTPMF